MSSFRKIFTPPVFDDEAKTQQAYMLNIILWTLVFVPVPYIIYSLIATPEDMTRAFIQSAFGIVLNIILLIVMRRGYVNAASIVQAASLWFFFTATAITGKGIQGEAYLIGYPLVITITGILLGGRETLVFTILSLSSGLFMVFARSQSSSGNQLSSSLLTTWVISLVLFPVGVILQRLAANKTRFALTRARASEKR